MRNIFKTVAVALAATGMAATAIPAAAADLGLPHKGNSVISGHDTAEYRGRDRWDRRDDRRYRDNRRYEASRYDNRSWRGNDGRQYCQKSNGTTGLLIGGAAGALLGREVDSRGDRTLGTVLGAAGGALLGKEVDSKVRCR